MLSWVAYMLVGILFVLTQFVYFAGNVTVLSLLLGHRETVYEEIESPDRKITALVPVYRDRHEVLKETIKCLRTADYPSHLLEIFILYEVDDELTSSYVTELETSNNPIVRAIAVNETDPIWDCIHERWYDGSELPQNKARALTFALHKFEFDDVVSVFDSDTIIEPSLFKQAIAGLKTYDLVQAKQTVRNIDDGWLPLLEAMGVTAWSTNVYERLTGWPYQLLGKGYFMEADTLVELGGWNPYSVTEDMELGIRAYKEGLSLGVIDSYVQDICPADRSAWTTQKVRWASGPYEILSASMLEGKDQFRFVASTFLNQMISVVNVIGIPIGLIEGFLYLNGAGHQFPPIINMIVFFNLLVWVTYSYKAYVETNRAVPFHSREKKLKYFILSNMVTQVLYATIWTIPIVRALKAKLRRESLGFEVTPK